jgi:hypothetical protein
MDPMIDFVRDRTIDLQRVADDVRRERDLRPTEPAAAVAVEPRRLEPVSRGEVACPPCDPVALATPAKHAA